MKGAADTGRNRHLAARVARELGVSMAEALRLVGAVVGAIRAEVVEVGHVRIRGFGRFEQRHVAERLRVNPKTRAPVVVIAHNKLAFRASVFKNASRGTDAAAIHETLSNAGANVPANP